MAATDGQIILAASRFGDTPPLYLRDFSRQKLPAIAKIVKGQHQNLGVPTLAAPSLQSISLFLSAGKKYQILAQPIKIKEGRKPTNVGAKVLIPETYTGYFELLSEDGRSTRCIDSVLELSKRRNLRVLVRETFRCALMNRTIHAGEMLTTMNDNGKYLQCKNIRDEIINLPLELKAKFSPVAKEDSISGVHTVRNLLLKRMPVIVRLVHGNVPKGLKQPFVPELRLLGCVEMDRIFALPLQKDNDLVPVPLNAKIKLQRSKNMDQLEHLIEYSRFLEKAQRLLTEARDRLQVVDLKLAADKERKDSKSGGGGRGANKLPVVMLPAAMGGYNAAGLMENGYVLRKSASCDSYSKSQAAAMLSSAEIADEYNEIDHIYDYVRGLTPLPKGLSRFEPISEAHTMKSYHTDSSGNYCSLIRGGVAATPTTGGAGAATGNNNNYSSLESSKGTGQHFAHHPTHQHHHQQHHQQQQLPAHGSHGHHQSASGAPVAVVAGPLVNHYHHSHIEEDIKPVPPPIETIPGKKLPEKRQRPTLPKLHLKNSHSSNSTSTNGNSSGASHHHGALPHHGHHHGGGNSPSAAAVVNGHHHQGQQPPPPSKILTPSNGNGNGVASPLSAAMLYKETASGHEPQSPLFHIRYKSLSSLQLTPDSNAPITPLISSNPKGQQQQAQAQVLKSNMNAAVGAHHNHNNCNNNNNNQAMLSKTASASIVVVGGKGGGGVGGLQHDSVNHNNNLNPREGTLDSSRSGGRTSGDSNKLPEKKTRRLSRPRSLSNLVWDLRPSKEKSKKKLYIHHLDHRQQATLYL